MAAQMQSAASANSSGLRVRLIGKANGVGLSRDFELLAAALHACGCEVTLRGCERRDRKRRRSVLTRLAARARRLSGAQRPRGALCDVNVMLEHVWPQFLHEAACNVVVPNPEWFDHRDVAFLSAVDCIWAKTDLAVQLFTARGCRSLKIGFDSEDRYQGDVMRVPQFFHLAGRSRLKGTSRLIALWRRHPEWPTLTIVQDSEAAGERPVSGGAAANVVYHSGYLGDAALRELQNAHRFHLCTSEAEGWGHYIAEALSLGAVTLTIDAPPMNELVTAARGILVGSHAGEAHNLVRLACFDDVALEVAVQRLLGLDVGQLEALGARARAWFLANKQGFAARVRSAVADVVVRVRGEAAA